jgi:hypothetical protein
MLMRVQRFMDTSTDALGSLNQLGSRRTLDDVVTSMSTHAVNQAASKRFSSAQTAKQRVLRNPMKVNHMRLINRRRGIAQTGPEVPCARDAHDEHDITASHRGCPRDGSRCKEQ